MAEAEAMEDHMLGADELAKKAYEYMEIVSFDIYGKPWVEMRYL